MEQPQIEQGGGKKERNPRYTFNRGNVYSHRNSRNQHFDRINSRSETFAESNVAIQADFDRVNLHSSNGLSNDASVENVTSPSMNRTYLPRSTFSNNLPMNRRGPAEFNKEKFYQAHRNPQYHPPPNNRKHRTAQNENVSSVELVTNDNNDLDHSLLQDSESQSQKVNRRRQTKNRNVSADYSEDSQSSKQCQEQVPQSLNSQRGKIVGGRYIRKHSNNPSTLSQMHSSAKRDSNFKENFNLQHHLYHSNRDSNQLSRDQQRRTYYDLNYQRDYAYESATNFGANSRRKTHSNSRSFDNVSSPTDVYHFSSIQDDRLKSNSPSTSHKEISSKLSRYKEDSANQRELLIHHLNKGECECLVCCEQIRIKDQTWHCLSCYHVFHLRCIRKWARSPAAVVEDSGWRCPACQSLTSKVPYDYYCFCGKQKNPDVNYHITPHSCGELCDRKRPDCSHVCKELCHPGPCPSCLIVVQKSCACGKTFKTTTCKQSVEETCSSVCDKLLNCGVHSCKSLCHPGECLPCEAMVTQQCFCGKESRTVTCTQESSTVEYFSCEKVCEKLLKCGHHKCISVCHSGPCDLCKLSVEVVKFCPCGKSSIEELVASDQAHSRKSCEDPIPCCRQTCERTLFCGPKDNPHKCPSSCHVGECPPCLLTTSMKCSCGAFTKEFECKDISPTFVYHCERRCNKRKDCGRHKCLNKCCVNIEHKCELICNKKLSCGHHQCQEICHAGNCPTCWNVSFDELRCHCGESVLYPPIHCGVKPPECSKPCIRNHPCDHEVKHTCHSEDSCPPCTSLTVKWCYGHHKQCGSVMCFMDGVSCGMSCQNPLPCEKHQCQLTCHPGPCLKPGESCTQLCTIPRIACGHPCGNSCHEGPCVDTPCKAQVTLACPCGHRSENATCYDSTKTYRLMSVSVLATKMQEIKEGQSVNLNDVLGRKSKNNKLQCNEECAVIERNKRLAVALQIHNPDLSCSPGPPSYSEFLKTEAKKYPSFVAEAYNKISDLVQLAKESKQKCRSHSFPPMNRDHRRVIHELAEFFGCETQSYDEEPKKNVVVTAYKTTCWLPFVSIMTVVQRDMGFRKGPAPLVAQRESKNPGANNTAINQKKKIDYFDYKE